MSMELELEATAASERESSAMAREDLETEGGLSSSSRRMGTMRQRQKESSENVWRSMRPSEVEAMALAARQMRLEAAAKESSERSSSAIVASYQWIGGSC